VIFCPQWPSHILRLWGRIDWWKRAPGDSNQLDLLDEVVCNILDFVRRRRGCRQTPNNIVYSPECVSNVQKRSRNDILLLRDETRSTFPHRKGTSNLIKPIGDSVNGRAFRWIVLNHIPNERVHEVQPRVFLLLISLGDWSNIQRRNFTWRNSSRMRLPR